MKKLLTIILISLLISQVFSQESNILDKKLTIEISNQSLEFYIELIEKSCKVNFSFNTDEIPLKAKINLPIGVQSFIEEIERFFKHKLPGSKSQMFNIKLNGLNITNTYTRATIEAIIRDTVTKIAPVHTQLYQVDKIQQDIVAMLKREFNAEIREK